MCEGQGGGGLRDRLSSLTPRQFVNLKKDKKGLGATDSISATPDDKSRFNLKDFSPIDLTKKCDITPKRNDMMTYIQPKSSRASNPF